MSRFCSFLAWLCFAALLCAVGYGMAHPEFLTGRRVLDLFGVGLVAGLFSWVSIRLDRSGP